MIVVVAALSGVFTFAAVLFGLSPMRPVWLRGRLAPHVPVGQSVGPTQRRTTRELVAHALELTESRFGRTRLWQALELRREKAGVSRATADLLWIALACSAATALCLLLLGAPPALVLLTPFVALVVLLLTLRMMARRRLEAFDEQLPQILDALAGALKVGHGLMQSLQAVAADAKEPAAGEFARVLAEARLGRPLETSFDEMARRLGSKELAFALTSMGVQRQVGGSLATLLETVAATVRSRQQFARKLNALTSMGRLSARVLMLLPLVVAGLLTAVNPGYMRPLVAKSTGQLLVAGSLVMLVCGSLILKRIASQRF